VKEVRVAYIQGSPGEIHELARYEIRPEALDTCLAAIHEFVAYVRSNEPEVEFIDYMQVDANAAFQRI
jgi:hypothetical protein